MGFDFAYFLSNFPALLKGAVLTVELSVLSILIGFCMGGMLAFKASGAGCFDRVAGFYGMIRLPDAWRGPELADAIDILRLPGRCPTLAVVGTNADLTVATLSSVETLKAGTTTDRQRWISWAFVAAVVFGTVVRILRRGRSSPCSSRPSGRRCASAPRASGTTSRTRPSPNGPGPCRCRGGARSTRRTGGSPRR